MRRRGFRSVVTLCILIQNTYSFYSESWRKRHFSYVPSKSFDPANQIRNAHLIDGGAAGEHGSVPAEEDLMQQAQQFLSLKDPSKAFDCLIQAFAVNPSAKGLRNLFASCMQQKIDVLLEEQATKGTEETLDFRVDIGQERMGLAALFIEMEKYEKAAVQLRAIVASLKDSLSNDDTASPRATALFDKSSSMLYRTNAALCDWENIEEDSRILTLSIDRHRTSSATSVPPLHPFEALKWPCISLEQASYVAKIYGDRAISLARESIPQLQVEHGDMDPKLSGPPIVAKYKTHTSSSILNRKIRLGYLSPDFTGTHPLAFLMQDVFQHHSREDFEVFIYSLSGDDQSAEVEKIKRGADHWIPFSQQQSSLSTLVQRIQGDDLDIMVDLCGHSGTSTVMELLACRLAPIQMAYMGFPGSPGAPTFIDYLICDPTVIPYDQVQIRKCYPEGLLLMPHCYFVNSHASVVPKMISQDTSRERYNLPVDAFVLCCHSRPDKIDPVTFRSWCRVLVRLKEEKEEAVLWLLGSSQEMQENLLRMAALEFGLPVEVFCFSEVAPRDEHLQRLSLANVFLDTPAYNAHTVGCDALFAGVPMVTLLRPSSQDDWLEVGPNTDKWASRVGASLLQAAGLDELIAPDLITYEELLYQMAKDHGRRGKQLQAQLQHDRYTCPLFDTARWVRDLETGLLEAVAQQRREREDGTSDKETRDILIEASGPNVC